MFILLELDSSEIHPQQVKSLFSIDGVNNIHSIFLFYRVQAELYTLIVCLLISFHHGVKACYQLRADFQQGREQDNEYTNSNRQ